MYTNIFRTKKSASTLTGALMLVALAGTFAVPAHAANYPAGSVTLTSGQVCTGATIPGTFTDTGENWLYESKFSFATSFINAAFSGPDNPPSSPRGDYMFNTTGSTPFTDFDVNPQNYCVDTDQSGSPINGTTVMKLHYGTGVGPGGTSSDTFEAAVYSVSGSGTPTITASPTTIVDGLGSLITWSGPAGASSCTGTNFNTGNSTTGSVAVYPLVTTNYSVTCVVGGQTSSPASVVVTVGPGYAQAAPDLAATTAGNTVTLTQGASTTLTATVSNLGSVPAVGPFPNIFEICDTNCATVDIILAGTSINNLGADSSQGITSVSFIPTKSGTYEYRACANTDTSWNNTINESIYSNNCSSTSSGWNTITVNAAPQPDLASPATPANVVVTGGATSTFSGVVENIDPSNPTTAGFYTNFQVCDPTSAAAQGSTPGNCNTVSSGYQSLDGDPSNPNGVWTASTINPSQTLPLSYSWTPPPAKTWALESDLNADLARGGVAGYFAYVVDFIENLFAPSASAASGSYTLDYRWCVNNNSSWTNIIAESNFANNCSGWGTMTVQTTPPTVSCSVSPTSIAAGSSATWTATPGGGAGAPYTYVWGGNVSGTSQAEPQTYPSAGTYTGQVTVTDAGGGTATASCTTPLTVISCTPTFTATPSTITQGSSSQLQWSIPGSCATSCTGTGFSTGGAISGTATVNPSTTSSYALTCNTQPPQNATVNVVVPSVSLTANPARVQSNGTTTLSWISTDTSACTVTRSDGTTIGTGISGTNVLDPEPITEQTIYTASCTTVSAPVSSTAIVNVVPKYNEY